MKTNFIILYIAFLWKTSLFAQQTREYVFSPDSVHIFNLPNPVNLYYLPYNITGITKPLFAEPFTSNASLPNSSQNIVASSGDIKNTFFGGDQPDGLGWGFTSTTVIINERFSKKDFPILLEGDFFNRDSYGGYNESYFWVGNGDYEHYNPSTSILPTPNVQEGILIGGLPERTIVFNGRNSQLPSEFFLNETHNIANYNNWNTLKTLLDITADGKLIVYIITINDHCIISDPIIISQPDYLTLNNFRLGICVDDLAKEFKVTKNYGLLKLDDIVLCQNEITKLDNINLQIPCIDFKYFWELPGSNIGTSNDKTPTNVKYSIPGNYTGAVAISNGQIHFHKNFNVTIGANENSILSYAICSGDSIYFDNRWIKIAGQYTQSLTTANGCDSIITLDLKINNATTEQVQVELCSGDSTYFDNRWIKTAGQYVSKYKALNGCDSLVLLDLKVAGVFKTENHISICMGDSIYFNNQWLRDPGSFEYIKSNVNGCDSLFTLTLDVKKNFIQYDTINTSKPYIWNVNDKYYSESGIYSESFRGVQFCDSTRILVLNIIEDDIVTFPNILKPGSESNGYFTGFSNSEQGEFLEISVYDRWGNLVFQRSRFPANEPQQGWDGRFKNRPVVQGVYVYLAKYKHANGNVTSFKGDITIVH